MWLGVALFNSAAVWAGDSGDLGTTQQFRGTVQEASPQVTTKQSAPGTSLRFAANSLTSEVSKRTATAAGSTMRFASPLSKGTDRSLRHGLVDVKENEAERGTFN
jgi:hypothetical protein